MKLPHSCLRPALLGAALLVSSLLASAQPVEKPVPVREEPNHKVSFENEYLRMIDVHFPAGQTTLYHIHTIPSVVVELSSATIVTQEFGAAPAAPRETKPGETRYAPYDEKPLTHRVTNRGPGIFHVLDIELLRSPATLDTAPAAPSPGLKLEWEQKLVRTYQLPLSAGQQSEVAANGCAHLLIDVVGSVQTSAASDDAAATRELKAGEYLFFAPHREVRVDNRAGGAASCLVLELK